MDLRRSKLNAPSHAAIIGLLSALAHGCSSSSSLQSAKLVSQADVSLCEYSVVDEVEASCTRTRCSDISAESCVERLAEKAGQLGADAVIVDEERYEGKGHAGAEPVRYWCKGRAIVWKQQSCTTLAMRSGLSTKESTVAIKLEQVGISSRSIADTSCKLGGQQSLVLFDELAENP